MIREFAEIGVFLLPSFLSGNLAAVPGSAALGLAIAAVLGAQTTRTRSPITRKQLVAFFFLLRYLVHTISYTNQTYTDTHTPTPRPNMRIR
jgi:hypothetical protein